MQIKVINNIESYLSLYVVVNTGTYNMLQFDACIPDVSFIDFTTECRKSTGQKNRLTYSEDFIENGEFPENCEYEEGKQKIIIVNAYERDQKLRSECIKKYGTVCKACGIQFKDTYGEQGKDFIEVHHIIPLHSVGESHKITADDLQPVCSNCHSMIHRYRDKELTIDELKEIIKSNREKSI